MSVVVVVVLARKKNKSFSTPPATNENKFAYVNTHSQVDKMILMRIVRT